MVRDRALYGRRDWFARNAGSRLFRVPARLPDQCGAFFLRLMKPLSRLTAYWGPRIGLEKDFAPDHLKENVRGLSLSRTTC